MRRVSLGMLKKMKDERWETIYDVDNVNKNANPKEKEILETLEKQETPDISFEGEKDRDGGYYHEMYLLDGEVYILSKYRPIKSGHRRAYSNTKLSVFLG